MGNNLDKQYTDLLQDILDNGIKKETRNGGTLSVFGRTIRHKMSEGFPILTTKHISLKNVATELIWFLKGDTNIKYLLDNNCNIWNGDAYKKYITKGGKDYSEKSMKQISSHFSKEEFINKIKTDDDFAKLWGELGPIYGKQWKQWNTRRLDLSNEREDRRKGNKFNLLLVDQIENLIRDLKYNPDSRRLMVNAWNVSELDKMTLPPCHYGFQCYTREISPRKRTIIAQQIGIKLSEGSKSSEEWNKECDEKNVPKRALSLKWNQRSVDTFLGLPYNIASYGLLLEILAKEVNMIPDELIGDLGDTHLYLNHLEQAKEQIGRGVTFEERMELWNQKNIAVDMSWHNMDENEIENIFNEDNIPKRTREPHPLPKLMFMSHLKDFDSLLFNNTYGVVLRPKDFILDNYQHHPKIEAPLSN